MKSKLKITNNPRSGWLGWDVESGADEAIGEIAWEPENNTGWVLMVYTDAPPLSVCDLERIARFMRQQSAPKEGE